MKLSDKKLSLMKENYYAEKDVKEFIKEILLEIELILCEFAKGDEKGYFTKRLLELNDIVKQKAGDLE